VQTPFLAFSLPGTFDSTPEWLLWAAFAAATALLLGSGWLIFRFTGSKALITPAYLFFAYYVVFVYVGGLYLVYNRGEGSYFHYQGQRNWVFFAVIALGMPAFAAGVWAAHRLFRFNPRTEPAQAASGSWIDAPRGRFVSGLVLALAAISLAVSAAIIALGPIPPLLLLLRNLGNHSVRFDYALDYARLAFISPHAGALPYQATTYQFYGNLLPLLGILAMSWWALRRNRRWLAAGLVLIGAAFFMASLTLAKNPIENLVIVVFIAWVNFAGRRLKLWQVSGAVAVAIGFFVAIVVITNRSASPVAILVGTFRRLFLVQVAVLYSVFETFPSRIGYLQGGGFWMDFRNLRPGPKESLDFGTWLYSQIVSNAPGLGGVGSAPTAFFGSLYADWGVPLALFGLFAVGFVCHWIFISFVRGPKTVIRWAVFVGLTASIPRLTTSSLISIAFQYGIITSYLFGIYLIGGDRILRPLAARLPGGGTARPEAVAAPPKGGAPL
jgi:hypothetical protein